MIKVGWFVYTGLEPHQKNNYSIKTLKCTLQPLKCFCKCSNNVMQFKYRSFVHIYIYIYILKIYKKILKYKSYTHLMNNSVEKPKLDFYFYF